MILPGDYVTHIDNIESIAIVLECYSPEEWAIHEGRIGASLIHHRDVFRIKWLCPDVKDSMKEYWWANGFVKIEENWKLYYAED